MCCVVYCYWCLSHSLALVGFCIETGLLEMIDMICAIKGIARQISARYTFGCAEGISVLSMMYAEI
jgi:hypothetical protein